MSNPDINKILAKHPRSCARGAPLGDINFRDSDAPLYLQQLRLVDGDYGADGTYWGGGGDPIYCAFNGEDDTYAAAMGTRIYVRARNREGAKRAVLEMYPDVKFRR